jgi:nucleotide-binding universal stress UspA family protein
VINLEKTRYYHDQDFSLSLEMTVLGQAPGVGRSGRHSPASGGTTFLVKEQPKEQYMGYTSIVCGVTGSAHAQKAALEAAALAKQHNAKLTYIYAVDIGFLKSGLGGLSTSLAEDGLARLGDQILGFAEQLAQSQGVTPKKVVRRGAVLEVLKQVIQEEKADLLVLGHEDRTFFEKAMFKGGVEDHIEELKQQTGTEVTVVT